jgi:hypothetical protein
MTIKFNRAAYMANECTHAEYYDQFVSEGLMNAVGSAIGVKRIKESTDEHFNDIPLQQWDNLQGLVGAYCGSALAESNASTSGGVRGISLSDSVCVAKAAARRIKAA